MKRFKRTAEKLAQEITVNKRQYLLTAGLFLLGILSGSIAAITTGETPHHPIKDFLDRFLSAYPLQGAAKSEVFLLSLQNHLRLAALMWISGWFVWLLPVGLLQVGSKGFRTGFTVACLLKCYGLRGILLAILIILPQNLLLIPALCFFMVYQLRFSADRRYLRRFMPPTPLKRQVYLHNLAVTAVFLFLLLLCTLIESCIVPTLLQPFCSLFY